MLGPFHLKSEKSALWTDTGVDHNFQRDLGTIGPYESQGKSTWINPLVPFFREKSVWTNGAESLSKVYVSPETGVGPWMALPQMKLGKGQKENVARGLSFFQHTVRTKMITFKIPNRLKNVIVSVIFAKLIPLGIPRCNCNQRVFPRNCYISRKSIRLGIKRCNCNCNFQEINSPKQKKLHVMLLIFQHTCPRHEECNVMGLRDVSSSCPPSVFISQAWGELLLWKATKEYLNQRGTKIRVFRVCFRAPFLPPIFPHFPTLFPLQALFTVMPLLPSSPYPLPPFSYSRKTPI